MATIPNPWIPDTEPDHRFVLDEARFIEDIEPVPSFLSDPRDEYLEAADIMPVLKVLSAY